LAILLEDAISANHAQTHPINAIAQHALAQIVIAGAQFVIVDPMFILKDT